VVGAVLYGIWFVSMEIGEGIHALMTICGHVQHSQNNLE